MFVVISVLPSKSKCNFVFLTNVFNRNLFTILAFSHLPFLFFLFSEIYLSQLIHFIPSYLFSLRASDLVMKVDALLSAVSKGEIRRDVSFKDTQRYALFVYHSYFFENIPQWKSEHWNSLLSVLQLSPRENEVFYDVVAIIDPLTREAQKISSLLIVRHSPVLFLFFQSARKQQAGWVKQHVLAQHLVEL